MSDHSTVWKEKLQELVDAAQRFGVEDGILDEAVHDAKSGEAAGINNSGLLAQAEYLLDECPIEELEKKFRELVGLA